MSLLDNLRALVGAAENLDNQRRAVLAEIEKIHSRPASLDPTEIARKRDDLADAELRLSDLDEAMRNAEAARADTARKAEEEAADAAHAAEARQATTEAKKLPAAALTAIEQAIAAIEALAASNERTAAYNEQRGSRPFVVDAETRVRQRPGRTIEARYEDREFWRDGAGREPLQFRKNERGELVPIEAGYTKVRERVCIQPEREIPATMPSRLAELLPALRKALA